MNVTLSIDDHVVAKARRIAAARGTTLNQLISDHLNELTRGDDMDSIVRELDAMWSERAYRSQGPWTREEAHERWRVHRSAPRPDLRRRRRPRRATPA